MSLYLLAKQNGLALAGATGAFRFVENTEWRRERLLILCYHGLSIADEHLWNHGLYMDAATFRRRLEILRDGHYNVLPLQEALALLKQNKLPEKSVVITFDDGMYDFYLHAKPLLHEFNFPATLYLTTYYCQHQLPIFDPFCYYLIWKGRGRKLNLAGLLPEAGLITVPKDDAGVRALYMRFYQQAHKSDGLSALAKDDLLRKLARALAIDDTPMREKRMLQIMTPAEVRQTVAGGLISFELHTHRHRTPRDRKLFLRELEDNSRFIEQLSGRRPLHFCYPSGDYTPDFFPWLAEFGALSATTCETGLASSQDHSFRLPRMLDAVSRSDAEFRGWLSGFNARF